jgi:RHS repeat-associated protein
LLATYDANDNLLQRYEYSLGQTPTAFTQGTNRFYIITDQIGTPRVITDATGTVVKQIEYDAYGNVINDTNPALDIPFGFAGGLKDNHTGLIRFGYRDFDPETGRWTARDPIGFAGGDTNLYGYVGANPIMFFDPNGLVKTDKWFGHNDQSFREWVHDIKQDDGGLRGADNYTKKELDEMYRQWEEEGKPRGKGGKSNRGGKSRLMVNPYMMSIQLACAAGYGDPELCELLNFEVPVLICPVGYVQSGYSCIPEPC